MKIDLDMFFLSLSNTTINFMERLFGRLIWKSYYITKALSTTCLIELIDKSEFAKVVLDRSSEIFVVYVAVLETKASIHLL